MTEMSSEKGLEQLKTWQKAMDLAVRICRELLPTFPEEERYALTSQLRRAAQSIPANIAEGYGRYHFQEEIRFCYIARGSLEETRSFLIFAQKMGYIQESCFQALNEESDALRKMINGYIAFLKKVKRGANEYGNPGQIRDELTPYQIDDDPQLD